MATSPLHRIALVAALAAAAASTNDARAAGSPITKATREQRTKAQDLFRKGRSELAAGKVGPALGSFRKSYGVVASPNSHLFVARCLVTLGRTPEAWTEYQGAIAEAREAAAKDRKYKDTQTAAEREVKALEASLGFVDLKLKHAPPDVTIEVGGREIAADALDEPLAVVPGSVTVVVRPMEGRKVERTLEVAAGAHRKVELDLTPPPPTEAPAPEASADDKAGRPWRTTAWAAGAVGVAGFATWAVAGAISRSQKATIAADCTADHPCDESRNADLDTANRNAKLANAGLVVGGVGAAVTVLAILLDHPTDAKPKGDETDENAGVRAHLAGGPSWIGVAGSF